MADDREREANGEGDDVVDGDDGELFGFPPPPVRCPRETLYTIIERLEKELEDSSHRADGKIRHASPTPSATTDTVSSRPSSGMSVHSEGDLAGNVHSDASIGAGKISRKTAVDLTNPMYKVPLEHGWRRELVFRANNEQSLRKQADVYYYSPTGKKLRSTREVAEHLDGTDLTVENFTFFKEPLGLDDPDKEIIRGAKVLKSRTDSPQPPNEPSDGTSPIVEGKRIPKPKAPKGSSPDHTPLKPLKIKSVGSRLSLSSSGSAGGSPAKSPSAGAAARISLRKSTDGSRKPTLDVFDESANEPYSQYATDKLPLLPVSEKSFFSLDPDNPHHVSPRIFPSSMVSDSSKLISQMKKYNPPVPSGGVGGRDMCPMRCPLANKEPPTLQCSLCLCLYHSECTGYLPISNTSFVCKNCHLASMPVMPVSPPTPQNTIVSSRLVAKPVPIIGPSHQRFTKSSTTLTKVPQPRLVPVFRPKNTNATSKYPKTDLKLPKHPKIGINSDAKLMKNMGSTLNSWPSPSSAAGQSLDRIQENSNQIVKQKIVNDIDPSIFPQSIAIVNGHKFIVVPKPNMINPPSTPVLGQMSNPRQADNAPKIIDTNFPMAGSASMMPGKYRPVEDIKEESKPAQFKSFGKSESFPTTNIISFDNLTAEYGKLLSSSGPAGFEQRGVKRSFSTDGNTEESTLKRKSKGPTPKIIAKVARKTENGTSPGQKLGGRGKTMEPKKNYFAEFYKANNESGYNSLVQIFQYLKMRELAAAARVCRMWREIADTPALWRSVRMKNSQVNDWEGLAAALKRHGTCHLDLRKMLHNQPPDAADKTWDQFIEHISKVDTLLRLDLCRCPASVVERVCERMPQLQALTAISVRCESLNPSPLEKLTNLQELRIKGMIASGLTLKEDLKCLESLMQLKHLSITSVKDIGQCGCIAIKNLVNLESLELGDCVTDIGGANLLKSLTKLTRLRLERCPGANGGAVLLRAAAALPELRQLELINFDIKQGFEEALSKCSNIKRLLIIPTYITQSATTNRCVLEGVFKLRPTLTHLVWGVTLELLHVTELFIDQCDKNQTGGDTKAQNPTSPKSKANGPNECIPVLKPVPGMPTEESKPPAMAGRPQVEILPLSALQRLLVIELPNTRLKLLRIPYHHTWRQTFNDFD